MKGGVVNDRVQLLVNRPVCGRAEGAGAQPAGRPQHNTDMIAAKVPLRERNRRGRWADGSNTADTVYDRTHLSPEADAASKVPVRGFDG